MDVLDGFDDEPFEQTTRRNSQYIRKQRTSVTSQTVLDLLDGSDLQGMIDDDVDESDEIDQFSDAKHEDSRGKLLFTCFWLLALTGIAVSIVVHVRGSSPNVPRMKLPTNLFETCSLINLDTDEGYMDCLHMCDPSRCCELSNGDGNSCFEENSDVCNAYRTACHQLDRKKLDDAASGKITVDEMCNAEVLSSKIALDACRGICVDYACCFEDPKPLTCNITSAICHDFGACDTLDYAGTEGFHNVPEAIAAIESACGEDRMSDRRETCQHICQPARCCFVDDDTIAEAECPRDCSIYEACSVIYRSSEASEKQTQQPSLETDIDSPDSDRTAEQPEADVETSIKDPREVVLGIQISCEWSMIELDNGKSCKHRCSEILCCVDGSCEDESVCSVYKKCYSEFPEEFSLPNETGRPARTDAPSSSPPTTTTETRPKESGSVFAFLPDVTCSFSSLQLDSGRACRRACNRILCCAADNCKDSTDCSLFDNCIHAFPEAYYMHDMQQILDPTAEPCSDEGILGDDGKGCRSACNQYSCCRYGTCFDSGICESFDVCVQQLPGEYSYPEEDMIRVWEAALVALFAGSFGAALGIAVAYPLDTIKTRAQVIGTRDNNLSFLALCKYIWGKDGIRGFYGGLRPSVVGEARIKAVAFSSYAAAVFFFEAYFPTFSPAAAIWIAAFFSGFCTSFTITPVDRIKVMMQTSWEYKNEFECVKAIVRSDGWCGLLYRGLIPTMLREIPAYGLYFGFYGLLMETRAAKVLGYSAAMIFGAVAGMCSTIPAFPIDKVKTLVQNTEGGEESAQAWIAVARAIYRDQGCLAFWDGLLPVLMRAAVYNAVQFLVFDITFTGLNRALGFDGSFVP